MGMTDDGRRYQYHEWLRRGIRDNLPRISSRASETASETMASGKGSKGSTNAPEPPSAYGKGHDIETNGFGPDTVINRNANYGAKTADPSYGVSNKPIGDYQLGTNDPGQIYVTGTSRTKMAAGAEDKLWLKAGDGTGVSGTPGRKVPGSLGSTGLDVGKPKVPDVPEIAGRGQNVEKILGNGQSLDKMAQLYAEKVSSNCKWSWMDDFPNADELSKLDKANIRSRAIEKGLIQNVPVKIVTGSNGEIYRYVDFESVGLVKEKVELPEYLWLERDEVQFKWLDNKIGGRPQGYTWHHSEISGQMELVPTGIHNIYNHNGGRTINHWAYREGGR